MIPESFSIPIPLTGLLIVRVNDGLTVIMNGLAPEPNTILITPVLSERKIAVVLERSKLAVSFGPLGTVAGFQLLAVFQSPLVGMRFQVALPPKDVTDAKAGTPAQVPLPTSLVCNSDTGGIG